RSITDTYQPQSSLQPRTTFMPYTTLFRSSALKGLPNVTLVGEASSGGSARAQVVELPASGLKARFASMASFQASGELFDGRGVQDRKSTRLNSSHVKISYAVFCLKKKNRQ